MENNKEKKQKDTEIGEENTLKGCLRNPDGSIKLRNPHIEKMENDVLYHLALDSGTNDLVAMFGDVKFICMGGTTKRMEDFAHYLMGEIGYNLPTGSTLLDISRYSYRYAMFKVGPVLSISHGMGASSVSILLHEIIKLIYHAKMKHPTVFRIGTCGGLGVESGTVVVTESVVDSMLDTSYAVPILGKIVKRPAILDPKLVEEIKASADPKNEYLTTSGKTMCASDFYEEQGRLDGAFCELEEKDKLEYLTKLHKHGVVNIEMESSPFAALTHHAGIRAAVVCVTIVNKLEGDQITATKQQLTEWQDRPQKLVARYIKSCLDMAKRHKYTIYS